MQLTAITPFSQKITAPLTKQKITVLQINLGKRCNLTCNHCHVEAGPTRIEEISPAITQQLITVIERFSQIKTVDLTGGAPEMFSGFRPLAEAAIAQGKETIVRSNLTIYFEPGYDWIPSYCATNKIRIVASLPCYLESNVDRMRGQGVYNDSIKAIQWLNKLGYGTDPNLILDLVYNPAIPINADKFSLTPNQQKLAQDYQNYLSEHFGIKFNHLITITNLPIGRTKFHLKHKNLHDPYLEFLESHFNENTIANLMCRNELSIDYQGYIYDCDFNQMENLPAQGKNGQILTVADLIEANSLDLIELVQTKNYCYGCTAGSGSSCGGALIS